jgi:hypothetical protein
MYKKTKGRLSTGSAEALMSLKTKEIMDNSGNVVEKTGG